jgi:NADH dehydrogenase
MVLVNKQQAHVCQPRLHEIAIALQSQAGAENFLLGPPAAHRYGFKPRVLPDVELNAREIVLDELMGANGAKVCSRCCIVYSMLVLAIGSEENDFRTPSAHHHRLCLNAREQAGHIRDALRTAAFRAAHGQQPHPVNHGYLGDATGVKLALAAEIKHGMGAVTRHEPVEPYRIRTRADRAGPPEPTQGCLMT